MKYCKNCEHWQQGKMYLTHDYDTEGNKIGSSWSSSHHPAFGDDLIGVRMGIFGNCLSDKFVYEDPEGDDRNYDTPDDGLMYWDGECWRAYFQTGQHFSCCHWKELKNEGS